MSTSTLPIIIPSDFDMEDALSSTNIPDYPPASPNYSPASPGNNFSNTSEDLSEDQLVPIVVSHFSNDPYMKVIQAYYATNELPIPPQSALIAPPTILLSSPMLPSSPITMDLLPPGFLEPLYPYMINNQDIEHMIPTTPPRDTRPPVGSPIPLSPSSSVGSSSPVRMAPNRTSTSASPAMTQATIRKLVADSVATALEAQAATMANTDNTNRNTGQRETFVAKKCSYKEFMSCQPLNFKATEGVVGLIRWFERAELVFYHSNCTDDCKVKFSNGTLTEDALSWWNSFAQPIGIEEAYKITWSELKRLLTKKYCPQTKVKKIEDEFYSLTIKGNDLKTYVGRFQELAVSCPTMVPNFEKLLEVFIEGLPQSIKGIVTASKPQTLEEATNIAKRLMDQILKHGADKSFISISLASMLNIPPITVDTIYDIEMDDGNLVSTNTVIQGCTLILLNQPFKIDLVPTKLGSLDVVIAQAMEKKSDEKRLEDIPVVREFLEVFPKGLPGLPPVRQIEFQIVLIPGEVPVARAPYRLAPSKMQELYEQLQELADTGFIRPSTSLRELLSYLLKRKTDLSECVSITEN
nr:reverse transcriptase domain-containing protein [Tanacetum cinerariifolium]